MEDDSSLIARIAVRLARMSATAQRELAELAARDRAFGERARPGASGTGKGS